MLGGGASSQAGRWRPPASPRACQYPVLANSRRPRCSLVACRSLSPRARRLVVQAAFGLVLARPPPRAGVLARGDRPRARPAADRRVAFADERVDRYVMVGDVALH